MFFKLAYALPVARQYQAQQRQQQCLQALDMGIWCDYKNPLKRCQGEGDVGTCSLCADWKMPLNHGTAER